MSAYSAIRNAELEAARRDPLSIAWVVGASLLMGVGIFFVTYWLMTFEWLYFGGILPMTAGILMMFDPRAGANASD